MTFLRSPRLWPLRPRLLEPALLTLFLFPGLTGTAAAHEPPEQGSARSRDAAHRERLVRETAASGDIDFAAEADAKRDEQITRLTKIIPKVEGTAKADLLFRLAELWWEKSKRASREAVLLYDQAMDAWAASGEAQGQKEPELGTFLRQSELFRHEALRAYRDILDNHRDYPRLDEVIFADAYNKAELGRRAQAIQGYEALVREKPQSKFVPDALIQLGELRLEAGELTKARAAYEKALGAAANPAAASFARYKLAWCDYNEGEDARAVARLKEVVAAEEASGKSGAGQKKEALTDLVPGFVRLEAADDAIRYFTEHATETEARRLIRKTAAGLLDAGQHASARKVFSWLISSKPFDAKGPDDQRAIVVSYEGERDRESVLRELKTLAVRYGPGSGWHSANASDKEAAAHAYEVTEAAMRTLVTDYHEEAQRTRSAATYRVARDIYREYLDRFPESAMAQELRFFYAEILWALEEYPEAGRQYAATAQADPKGRFARDAAYDAVLAFEKALAAASKSKAQAALSDDAKVDEKRRKAALTKGDKAALLKKRADTDAEAQALSPLERESIDAIDRFAALFPDDPEAVAARYKAAFILYEKRADVEAARRLGGIIDDFPADPWSKKAVSLTLRLLDRQKAWLELHGIAERLSKNAALTGSDGGLRAHLEDVSAAALYKHLDETVLGREGDRRAAAEGLEQLARERPDSRYAPQAAFYAFTLWTQSGETGRAVQLGKTLLERWPQAARLDGGDLTGETHRLLGHLLLMTSAPAEAEKHFGAYLSQALSKAPEGAAAGSDEAREALGDALLQAASCAEALDGGGAQKQGAARLLTFARLFPARPEAAGAVLRAAKLLGGVSPREALEALLGLDKAFAAALPAKDRLELLAAQALWAERAGERARTDEAARAAESLFGALPPPEQSAPEVRESMAQVRFARLETDFREAAAIDFHDPQRLKQDLADKVKRIGELEERYMALLPGGSQRHSLMALARLGELYADFSQKLVDSADPPGLTDDELDLYRTQLEERAAPLEEKAAKAFASCIAKSLELGLYGPWLTEAQDGLERLHPDSFRPARDLPPASALGISSSAPRPFEATAGGTP